LNNLDHSIALSIYIVKCKSVAKKATFTQNYSLNGPFSVLCINTMCAV